MRYPLIAYQALKDTILYIPDPIVLRSVYESYSAVDASTPFPYWAQIWPSAKAMLQFLQEHPTVIQSKRVVELGAGIGLPSLLMAKQMKHLVVSDYDADAVGLMKKNIEHLKLINADARCIDWNSFPNDLAMDIVMLCDVNYAPNEFEGLLQLVRTLIDQGTTILLATPQRITASTFVESITSWIKQSEIYTIDHYDTGVDISILILSA